VRCLALAAEQLSMQDHYDFSMRTVKASIVCAGELKHSNPDAPEVGLTYRAIVECNVPKLVQVPDEDRTSPPPLAAPPSAHQPLLPDRTLAGGPARL
jgi:hypothetical protein